MDYIKIRFVSNLDPPDTRFDKTVEELFRSLGPVFTLSERSWKPQVDIYETEKDIIVLAEIAGVDKENLELEINSKSVKIAGRRAGILPQGNARYRLAEIQYGRFERTLALSVPIDTNCVSASYSNGFLRITMAKMPLDKTHTIPIECK